jgi:hypothetical protein
MQSSCFNAVGVEKSEGDNELALFKQERKVVWDEAGSGRPQAGCLAEGRAASGQLTVFKSPSATAGADTEEACCSPRSYYGVQSTDCLLRTQSGSGNPGLCIDTIDLYGLAASETNWRKSASSEKGHCVTFN